MKHRCDGCKKSVKAVGKLFSVRRGMTGFYKPNEPRYCKACRERMK